MYVELPREVTLMRRVVVVLRVGLCAVLIGCTSDGSAVTVATEGPRQCADAGDPARERHGSDCLCCHATTEFGIAGSIAPGSPIDRIVVTDSDGNVADMAPNAYDNFFRHVSLKPPLTARVVFADGTDRTMRELAPHGSCNSCHAESGQAPPIGAR